MDKTNLQKEWLTIAGDLGIEVDAPHMLKISPEAEIMIDVLIKQFGGDKGMCLVVDYERIQAHTDEMDSLGYGFAIVSEPGDNEQYDREGTIQLLREWMWTGSGDKPDWY